MRPLQYYFVGSGTWFLTAGIQSVLFAWLVTIVLDAPADKVGIAQMSLLLPSMLLMLVGGSLADRFGGKRLLLIGQTLGALAPMTLALMIAAFGLTYSGVIAYALVMGIAQATVTPARDGLLNTIAEGAIQRRVMQVSMLQFGIQMLGFAAASQADRVGAIGLLSGQTVLLLLGVVAFYLMQVPPKGSSSKPGSTHSLPHELKESLIEGYRSVRESPYMSRVVILNFAIGAFFMGSYIVTVPLIVREVYAGTSQQIAWINIANSIGFILTIMALLRLGDVHRQGRAVLLALILGAIILGVGGLGLGFASLVVVIFLWGSCGGVAMTLLRTIMQEQSPDDQRSRMMAFHSFAFMGAGPVGTLLSGYLSKWLGPGAALILCAGAMVVVAVIVGLTSRLWQMDTTPVEES